MEGRRVLLVDDDRSCIIPVEAMLKAHNYEVVAHENPVQALKELREKKGGFDLVLTDVHMPEMNGLELLYQVKKEFNIPVILMSREAEKDIIIEGALRGASVFLMKPLSMNEVQNLWQHTIKRNNTNCVTRRVEKPLTIRGSTPIQKVTNEEIDNEETESESWSMNKKVNNLKRKQNGNNKRKHPREVSDEEKDEPSTKKLKRMVWDADLRSRFLEALDIIGGEENAVPKQILEIMKVPGLTREHVASHLQKYRIYSKRVDKGEKKTVRRRSLARSAFKAFTSSHPLSVTNVQPVLPQFSQASQTPSAPSSLSGNLLQGNEVVPSSYPNFDNGFLAESSGGGVITTSSLDTNTFFQGVIHHPIANRPTMQIASQQQNMGSSCDNLSQSQQPNSGTGTSRSINSIPYSPSGSLNAEHILDGDLSNILNFNGNYIGENVAAMLEGISEGHRYLAPPPLGPPPVLSSDFTTQNEAHGSSAGFSSSTQFLLAPPPLNDVASQKLSSDPPALSPFRNVAPEQLSYYSPPPLNDVATQQPSSDPRPLSPFHNVAPEQLSYYPPTPPPINDVGSPQPSNNPPPLSPLYNVAPEQLSYYTPTPPPAVAPTGQNGGSLVNLLLDIGRSNTNFEANLLPQLFNEEAFENTLFNNQDDNPAL